MYSGLGAADSEDGGDAGVPGHYVGVTGPDQNRVQDGIVQWGISIGPGRWSGLAAWWIYPG